MALFYDVDKRKQLQNYFIKYIREKKPIASCFFKHSKTWIFVWIFTIVLIYQGIKE